MKPKAGNIVRAKNLWLRSRTYVIGAREECTIIILLNVSSIKLISNDFLLYL